jgi:hypothetical protein
VGGFIALEFVKIAKRKVIAKGVFNGSGHRFHSSNRGAMAPLMRNNEARI